MIIICLHEFVYPTTPINVNLRYEIDMERDRQIVMGNYHSDCQFCVAKGYAVISGESYDILPYNGGESIFIDWKSLIKDMFSFVVKMTANKK